VSVARRDRFGGGFLLTLVLVTAVLFFWMVRMFFVPVLLAAVFATLFHPLYRGLLRASRGYRAIASLIACVVLLIGLLLPLYFVVDRVTREALDLWANLDVHVARLARQARGFLEWAGGLPGVPEIDVDEIDWTAVVREGAGTATGMVATVVRRTSRGTLQVVLTVFVTLFTMFYFFIDGRRLVERVRYLVPLDPRYEDAIVARFVSVARASVKGTLVIALVQGAIGGVTLALCGVEAAVLWGVVMVVLSIIPVIGAWLVMYPAAIVQMMLGNFWQGIAILLVTVVVIVNVDNVLRPRLVGQESGLHDLLIFFSVLGGFVTFGAMGFIVGPVIAAFFVAVLDAYAQEFAHRLGPLVPFGEPASESVPTPVSAAAAAGGDEAPSGDVPPAPGEAEGTEGRPPQR
jgi:predicted PurR-regulated permease PerM